ncbi:hypothetical protein O9Z70_05720 [Devosia sp. YIM 151766]|uniref:hypothetical protein n=1 Tax=Devosia sp. YIM 151766 TaxID=3017325 RepID=UPI00255C5082|nr:hypothetical protein [Devosia sp. YIM 151766]WIY54025.1 hypothetical protein O9Z70_05720 [Devosia sp. YIM 151766]
MMTISKKRRLTLGLKSALVVGVAVILFTPKDIELPDLGAFPLISQAYAGEVSGSEPKP